MAYNKLTPTTAPYIGTVEEKEAPAKTAKAAAAKPAPAKAAPAAKKECHLESRVAELEARVELLLKVLKKTPGLNIDKLSEGKL